jgi:hypothetical protein
MTYAVGGLIQAYDYNTFASTGSPNVNDVWSVGSGNKGYGQSTLSEVAIGDIVYAINWANLFNAIQKSGNHQGSTLGLLINPNPIPGQLVLYEAAVASNISVITNNRLNAVAQSSTVPTTVTRNSTWNNYLEFTFTVTFSSNNAARYFFNAGGQIGFNFSHPTGTGINSAVNEVCSDTGTVWLSSPTGGSATLAGVTYNGVTKIGGGAPAETTINTNLGFHALTSTDQTLFQQDSTGGYYPYPYPYYTGSGSSSSLNPSYYPYYPYYGGNLFLRIRARLVSNVITFTILIDTTSTSTVSAGTTANLILRNPSTTYLANSWGTPGVIGSITS